MDFVFLALTFVFCLPVAHYLVHYLGWEHPEYHKDDLRNIIIYSLLALLFLFLTVLTLALE